MEHYDFEFEGDFSDEDFLRKIEEAKRAIVKSNGLQVDCMHLARQEINKIFNDYRGVFTEFRIEKEGVVIGYFEYFKSNNKKYYTIYTSSL